MNRILEILFLEYVVGLRSVGEIGSLDFAHWFNFFEGAARLVFAALVFGRHFRFRRSRVDVVYAVAFVLFGLTDFREPYCLQSWLLWLKLAILIPLFLLRRIVMRRFYPESKVY